MRALDIPSYAAIGILESLWNLCAREAPQGNIGKLNDADIADAIGWDRTPKDLIDGLVESGWLDRSNEFRVIVHDWRDHADDAVDNALARAHLRYADGSIPRMNRLSKNEREQLISLYLQSVRTETHEKPLPEPSQSLARASAGATAAHTTAPPPVKLAPSAGANGEFMLAQELGREIKLAMRAGDIALVAQVIANETPEHGDGLKAKDFIRDRALEARSRGEPVTVFWLQDRKFDRTQAKDVYQQFLEADV